MKLMNLHAHALSPQATDARIRLPASQVNRSTMAAWYADRLGAQPNEVAMAAQPQAFTLKVPDQAIADLRERLGRTRFPDQAPGEPWAYGMDVRYLRQLVEYWRSAFDWRAEEARLNGFPQYKVPLDGIDLHFLHVPGKGPAPCPLLLLHGWPGSVFEFLELIPRLTDPARFGGDPEDSWRRRSPATLCRFGRGSRALASRRSRTASPR
jgi:hypothetical protein